MTTSADVARQFISDLGATPTPGTIKAVQIWLSFESGGRITGNNPWNLHSWGGLPGQTGYRYAGSGDRNVATFGTLREGIAASAANLVRLRNGGYGYDRVIDAVHSGNGRAVLAALANSSWSAGHYSAGGVRGAKLFAAWNRTAPPSSRITFEGAGGRKPRPVPVRPAVAYTRAHPRTVAAAGGLGLGVLALFVI